ncbi:hypothetical protein BJF93_04925 [Xaviernesmea oryzae]|uniref:HTH araC/xylS-type domain-containing protein n=1 Tax=Xaviernesmea oryzae TaxID=464029 RepID=A0A1Q9AUX8_9HYPH|nr:AraC family transcriptional regulator [Xaviernesmea oryzae]OLP59239.1 hypothetical protein BJF93_04925 [Xaviernesmea oryzae]SEK80290.1 AraC-type DNA-binding protein [Xaviernesmea oryzae]
MPAIPLPFLAGLIIALTLHANLKGVSAPGPRGFFTAFLLFYAMQGVIIGLRFGYGLEVLAPVQPVTAAAMPPLATLAFLMLADRPPARLWVHALPPLLVALAVLLFQPAVDLLLFVIFAGYGVALWRIACGGEAAAAEAEISRMRPILRTARLTSVLMLYFAVTDTALSIWTLFQGRADVPVAVGLMNIGAIVLALLSYLAPVRAVPPEAVDDRPSKIVPDQVAHEEDREHLARIEAALDQIFTDENLTLAKLARKAGLPARTVSAVINRATGFNLSQFVNNRRVAEVCRLIEADDRPLTALMLEAGFSTKSNFNREFRRVTGLSPSAFRAEVKKAVEAR